MNNQHKIVILLHSSWVVIFVDAHSTNSTRSSPLFNVRFFPSSKATKISKTRAIVVVSVPQLLTLQSTASIVTSHYRSPHRLRSINANFLLMIFDSIYKRLQKSTVGGVVLPPTTTWTWISLNIYPNHSIQIFGNRFNHFVDLRVSRLTSTWKHVNVCNQLCSFSISKILDGI